MALEVRPLLIVREHAGGFFSAFAAYAPKVVSYANERDDAVDELRLFLGEHFARLDGDQLFERLVPEDASVREVSVLVPREDLPKPERIRTPIDVQTVELVTRDDARWVLVPALGHAVYVPRKEQEAIVARVSRDILRVAGASELDGSTYLDLLPTLGFELERPVVEIEPRPDDKQKSSPAERALKSKHKAAQKLLETVGRRLEAPKLPVLHRDLAGLRALLQGAAGACCVLVGPSRAGKSALMRAAVAACDPARIVFATSGAELVAGQSGFGQLEDRVEAVMRAAETLDCVLYFEELDDLFAGRPGGYEDIAGLMQRHIEAGRVRIVGELTPEQYDRLAHRHVGFFSYFSRIAVDPLDRAQTLDLLRSRAEAARGAEEPALADAAAPLVVDLVERYDPYRALPGKALALLEELVALRRAEPRPDDSLELTADYVFRGLSAKTGVPEFLLRDDRSMLIADVERFFRERVIGQEAAIRRVAETLCTVKARLQPASKPLAAFLFIGPTGVGKTELAKALARFLFGSSERLARFDMSEYADPYAAERLIRGTDRDDGVLTRRIREQPFSVLLLDEIEKADSAVFDLLLQVLGEGRLSDARGKIAYFVNSIIIMTSNLGAQQRRAAIGFGDASHDEREFYMARVREHFRPEFVNRLDRIVAFSSLSPLQIREVLKVSLSRIASREAFADRDVRLSISDAALARLAEQGFSPSYGARGLRRHLEQALLAPAAATLSALGREARGSELAVDVDDAADAAGSGEILGSSARGGLRFRVFRRERRLTAFDVDGLLAISAYRREARRLLELPVIRETRERVAEIQAQLSLNSARRRKRRLVPQGAAVGQLSEEHARLSALLAPLDKGLNELEDIESLLISALAEDAEPELLEPEAKAAHRSFCDQLVRALMLRSDENEVTLAIVELDDRRVRNHFVLPLLDCLERLRFEVKIHVDREARTDAEDWPGEVSFGPPRSIEYYRDQYAAGFELPSPKLLIRVKGPGAGALLSFAIGRWRYHLEQGVGELWVQFVAARFELEAAHFAGAKFRNNEQEIGRRQPVCLQLPDGSLPYRPAPGERVFEHIRPDNVFQHWYEVIFARAVAVAEVSGDYLPAGG